ncbi:hypothetical protein B0O99DRAFT_86412 [Bisporella sp. PMI_857]|nr:hypothetical protein B0O99DRAFT_86412 [Bisporella sp. PMI_857]
MGSFFCELDLIQQLGSEVGCSSSTIENGSVSGTLPITQYPGSTTLAAHGSQKSSPPNQEPRKQSSPVASHGKRISLAVSFLIALYFMGYPTPKARKIWGYKFVTEHFIPNWFNLKPRWLPIIGSTMLMYGLMHSDPSSYQRRLFTNPQALYRVESASHCLSFMVQSWG